MIDALYPLMLSSLLSHMSKGSDILFTSNPQMICMILFQRQHKTIKHHMTCQSYKFTSYNHVRGAELEGRQGLTIQSSSKPAQHLIKKSEFSNSQ